MYTRKKELSFIFLQVIFCFLFLFLACVALCFLLDTSEYSKYLILLLFILGIILYILQKWYNTLLDELDNIRTSLSNNFWEEEMLTMIETFNDEQFNKILKVSRSIDKNNEEIEKNNVNKRIQEIKNKYNI